MDVLYPLFLHGLEMLFSTALLFLRQPTMYRRVDFSIVRILDLPILLVRASTLLQRREIFSRTLEPMRFRTSRRPLKILRCGSLLLKQRCVLLCLLSRLKMLFRTLSFLPLRTDFYRFAVLLRSFKRLRDFMIFDRTLRPLSLPTMLRRL